MTTQNKRLMGIIFTTAFLLLIPLIAMQFSEQVNWNLLDFIVAGGLLFATGIGCEFVLRKVNKIQYRIGICLVILAALLLIWAELAVGILGTPFAGT